jgi:hypothetical protein
MRAQLENKHQHKSIKFKIISSKQYKIENDFRKKKSKTSLTNSRATTNFLWISKIKPDFSIFIVIFLFG